MMGRASVVKRASIVYRTSMAGRRNSSRNRMRETPCCFYAKSTISTLFVSILRILVMYYAA
jgi:hypothetical protein